MTAERLVGFLSGEARRDSWREGGARLSPPPDERRPNVAAHAARVADNARLLALDVGMKRETADAIHAAALLHDVGKLAVSEAVLHKNGPLDEAERREMKLHAAYGFGLLDVPGAPRLALDVAKYHHERYDGAGYFGLAGERVPYAARIAAVADVHEALTARREYKAAMPEGDALSIMTADAAPPAVGRAAFDPYLLRRFVAMRLRDPALEASPRQRVELEEFSRSDPMAGLGPSPHLRITREGLRMFYDVDAAGGRTLVAMMRSDGSELSDFPRLTPSPSPSI